MVHDEFEQVKFVLMSLIRGIEDFEEVKLAYPQGIKGELSRTQIMEIERLEKKLNSLLAERCGSGCGLNEIQA